VTLEAAARRAARAAFKAPRERDAFVRLDDGEAARDGPVVADDDAIDPARTRVERRLAAHPPHVVLSVGEHREDELRRRVDVQLVLDTIVDDGHVSGPLRAQRRPSSA
jgi:hypothetical protein